MVRWLYYWSGACGGNRPLARVSKKTLTVAQVSKRKITNQLVSKTALETDENPSTGFLKTGF
jgi:hypothetical protein